jgi:ABC-type multidrug transport system fused ATPase/permease subunit
MYIVNLHLGLYLSDIFLHYFTQNIAHGYPDSTIEQVEEAAKVANAHDFIMSFPDGYDTQVGDKGTKLSGGTFLLTSGRGSIVIYCLIGAIDALLCPGIIVVATGQKQRIAIARILIKNPKVLLLDEATSALDSESERVVQRAIDRLLEAGNRTTIVIAHRLSTIRNADMIAVVDGGKLLETGTHEELLEKQGHYYMLVEAQKAPHKEESNSPSSLPASASASRSSSASNLNNLEADEAAVLRFHDVHFTYPSRRDIEVFRGLNLSVRPGETMALVGPSGHGKSTVIQLAERFYDPSEGSIELDGVDLKSLNVKWLRSQVGLVSQEPTLFDTTIGENIIFGLEDVTQEQIEMAAREANAHDFIMSFPDGYDTMVGEGGTQVRMSQP